MDPADIEQGLGNLPQQALDAMFMTEPQFEPATALDANGHLVLDGVYRTEIGEFTFTYSFMDRRGEWKLVGMSVEEL
jgi:hypothetical protein